VFHCPEVISAVCYNGTPENDEGEEHPAARSGHDRPAHDKTQRWHPTNASSGGLRNAEEQNRYQRIVGTNVATRNN